MRRESILILAVGGGVDKSSLREGETSGTNSSFAKLVARYSDPCSGSNSFITTGSWGDLWKTSYGANRGDGVRGTFR